MDNYIKIYDNTLDSKTCGHYINLIESSSKRVGGFMNKENQRIINTDIKLSEELNFSLSFPKETQDLLLLFSNTLKRYEKDINNIINIQSCEHFVGRVYRKGKGHYNQHIDCYSAKTITRCLSVLLYLNNVEEGGELKFSNQDINIKAKEGRIVIFPSYWMYKHGAEIPLDTDRYMIRTFMSLINYE